MSVEIPNGKCPVCGSKMDRASTKGDPKAIPSKGDVSVCFYCASFLVFDENLNLTLLSNEEFRTYPEEFKKELQHIRTIINQKIVERA